MEEVKYSICVSALQKKYKDKEVLSNVTFSVPKGTIYTLLGSSLPCCFTSRAKSIISCR